MITVEPDKVTAILIASAGWEPIIQGSLTIDQIKITPPEVMPTESEDYGFVCVTEQGTQITGRMSALLATKRSSR